MEGKLMITFILGGARSGKSRRAQSLAEANAGELIFIATAQAFDDEMTERIARHRGDRDHRWRTVESPLTLAAVIEENAKTGRVLLVDCLTLWMSNLLLHGSEAEPASDELVKTLAAAPCPIFVVSNEVGLGIVPENALARQFRDEIGCLHQRVAAIADRVEWMAAGLVLRMK
jgi:adenosylcobinamide kinase / adenosylcobinamide-phosphate guanylyltransferase